MGFLDSLFGNKDRRLLLELIEHNADMIEINEKRTRADAEYLALCSVLNDLATRPNGQEGHKLVMDILLNEYSQHHNDVITYLAVIHEKNRTETRVRRTTDRKASKSRTSKRNAKATCIQE